MNIDMMDDVVWTDAQITKRGNALIASLYPGHNLEPMMVKSIGSARGRRPLSAEEEAEETAYMTHALTVKAGTDTLRLLNARKIAAIAYERAVERLARYRVVDGQLGQAYQAATYDELGNELTPEVPYIPAIDPLPLQVEEWDYTDPLNPVTVMVDNPAVAQDDAERSAAQAVISGATQQILDDVATRAQA